MNDNNLNKPYDLRWMDEHNRISAKFAGESDRAVALLAVAFLESQLRDALQGVLVDDSKVINELFTGFGPLSALSARIGLVYALGLVSKAIFEELHMLRKIRNEFAHHPDVIDFETPRVKDRCALLRSGRRFLQNPEGDLSAREAFLWSVSTCVGEVRLASDHATRPKIPDAGLRAGL